VRHTARGRVLVGVRRGGGHGRSLRVEVRDTGPGIAAGEQDRVFQEFYQINNPERDRTKGLGLGLAILRRIAILIEAPLTLSSRAGRGACFALGLRIAEAPLAAPETPAAPEATHGGGQILVVEDEAGVRAAMQSLLASWGYEVIVAGSLAEMLERVSGQGAAPQLLICDYRLRDGDDGLEVIAGLRARFDHEIPAMLVTGDTAPDRISSARASGFVLLYKPVPSGKLRAAIANLIRTAKPLEPAALA
jgi:CheY-like chemotaxis protein